MEVKELVFRKIPFTVITGILLFSVYQMLTGGIISGLPIIDANIKGKIYHFRTLILLSSAWLITAYYNRDKKPHMGFFIATTVSVNGLALLETIHHVLTWSLIVERYGYTVFFKDLVIYAVFFCMNIPIIEKYSTVETEFLGLGMLFLLVFLLAWVKYPMLTFDFGRRDVSSTLRQGIPLEKIDPDNVFRTVLNRVAMTSLKTSCLLPFLYYSTRLRKIES